MGTDGACGLLFCAAKRSGALPPNIPAELMARVSRLGGFMIPVNGQKPELVGQIRTEKMATAHAPGSPGDSTGKCQIPFSRLLRPLRKC
jgi:hypothetical protein